MKKEDIALLDQLEVRRKEILERWKPGALGSAGEMPLSDEDMQALQGINDQIRLIEARPYDEGGELYLHVGNSGVNIGVWPDEEHGWPAITISAGAFGNLQSDQKFYVGAPELQALGELFLEAAKRVKDNEVYCHSASLRPSHSKGAWALTTPSVMEGLKEEESRESGAVGIDVGSAQQQAE